MQAGPVPQHAWPSLPHAFSHPSARLLLASVKPGLHAAYPHCGTVPAQLGIVAFSTVTAQLFPHDPQLASVFDGVSQPVFPGVQWSQPLAHDHSHVLFVHVGVPWTLLQIVLQPPQFSSSDLVSRQSREQHVPPLPQAPVPVQTAAHLPAGLHLSPLMQSPSPLQLTH